MLVLHCDPRCDGDVVVSSPDVSPFSSPPLMSFRCSRCDVVAALPPCEKRYRSIPLQRSETGMHVIDVLSSFVDVPFP